MVEVSPWSAADYTRSGGEMIKQEMEELLVVVSSRP
jgi:hypothetical protein